MDPIAEKLDNQTILDLSVKIDGEGVDPAVAARDRLVEQGFVSKSGA
jgi:osmoprotectant transport system substrate-binding protein